MAAVCFRAADDLSAVHRRPLVSIVLELSVEETSLLQMGSVAVPYLAVDLTSIERPRDFSSWCSFVEEQFDW
jgi:hypothetical protein